MGHQTTIGKNKSEKTTFSFHLKILQLSKLAGFDRTDEAPIPRTCSICIISTQTFGWDWEAFCTACLETVNTDSVR